MMAVPARTSDHRDDPVVSARIAWRRRVSRIGSLIQLAFAALWFGRGMLATGFPGRVAVALGLVVATMGLGVWWGLATRGLAPRPRDREARRLERSITVATIIQLAASVALPFVVIAAGRPDLIVPTVAVTIALLLLWLRAELGTPGHLVAGLLLVVVPAGLAMALSGNPLTATAGLVTGAILLGSGAVGMYSLRHPTRSPVESLLAGRSSLVPLVRRTCADIFREGQRWN